MIWIWYRVKIIWYTCIFVLSSITSDALDTPLLINCGLPKSTQSKSPFDGRVWQSDDNPAFAPSNLDTVSTTVSEDADDLPFKVGRVFWSDITYTFSITPGPVFLRLYFFPNVSYNNTPSHQFSTSLVANNFILLRNFNPFLNSLQETVLQNEFQLILQKGDNNLKLTLSPGKSYGYVNGIEIESIPEGLYINESNPNYLYATYPVSKYSLGKNSTAFQTAYRLNVGGENVDKNDDNPGGMKRKWETDEGYIVGQRGIEFQLPSDWTNLQINYTKKTPSYAAPKIVYETSRSMGDNSPNVNLNRNITWKFEVDAGFDYVVRLHLCELCVNVTGRGNRVMDVYINGFLVDSQLDIWYEAGGFGIPMYKDYVTTMPPSKLIDHNGSKVALSLALHPHYDHITDISLSGLEILKLSAWNRNLAVPNPHYTGGETLSSLNQTLNSKSRLIRKIIPVIIGGVLGGLVLVSIILLTLFRRRLQHKTQLTPANLSRPSLPSDLCQRFSLTQIRVATRDFDETLIIGKGGFGKVYKGCICIDGGATDVAVKRLNPTSKQGEHEFLTEIEMLTRLRHKHLVSLIGYCDEMGEMILIYEYMPRGTLCDHLNYRDSNGTNNNEVLSWKQRLTICLGSARGLEYLHTGTKQLIIHRDVKSTNILLDDKWTAMVSDFGLSKVSPASDTDGGHVSTIVKGSFGYLDPDYYQRGQLTEKSDIYSFGVMLFEVLCDRPAVDLNLPTVRACCTKGILYTLVDPSLTGQIMPECLNKFGEIAELCVRVNRDERPSMRDVVWSLESILTLQQTAENTSDGSPMVDFTISSATCGGEKGASTSSFVTTSHMDLNSGSVFSEVFDLEGR